MFRRPYLRAGRSSRSGPDGLAYLAEQAFRDVAFHLRPSHLKELQRILDDPEASDNDKYVVLELLQNAIISAEGVFPQCQDTGTAIIIGKKGQAVWTDGKRRGSPVPGCFQRLHPELFPVFSERAPHHVRREEYRLESPGPDRVVCHCRATPTNSSLSLKAEAPRTRRASSRKQKPP